MTSHLEAITAEQQRAIVQFGPFVKRRAMYLAGGTAVAIQLGHRQSVDLDWFSPESIDDPIQMAQEIRDAEVPLQTDSVDRGTLHGQVFGVRVSILEYRYPLLEAPAIDPALDCPLASIHDLAAMKLVAVAQRGSKKDFVDIYAIGANRLSLDEMLDAYRRKYSLDDVARILYSLTYFDDADPEPMPRMLWESNWDAMKDTIRKWVKEMAG
jgi:hypothetical protein